MPTGLEEVPQETSPSTSATNLTNQQKNQAKLDRYLDRKIAEGMSLQEFKAITLKVQAAYALAEAHDKLLPRFLNQKGFPQMVQEELEFIKKYNLKAAYIMIDVDKFKEVNDNLGHPVGDLVLKAISKAITESTRDLDVRGHLQADETAKTNQQTAKPGRIGGDELAILLTGADANDALIVIERIRKKIPEVIKMMVPDFPWEQTISVGVAEVGPNDTVESLKEYADEALYKAKEERNAVVVYAAESCLDRQ